MDWSIKVSAVATKVDDIVSPGSCAVLRLITSAKLVGCWKTVGTLYSSQEAICIQGYQAELISVVSTYCYHLERF